MEATVVAQAQGGSTLVTALLALTGLAVLLVLILAMVLLLARRSRPRPRDDRPPDGGAGPDPWREAGRRVKAHSDGG